METKKQLPRILLVLWTTDMCNLKCKYCYADQKSSYGNMDIDTAIKAIDYFKGSPLTIQFAGGEPLMNFTLIEKVYDYVLNNSLDVKFQIQTNGTLLTRESVKKLKRMNMGIGISLDGVPIINESLRGRTKEVLYALELLKSEGVIVNINSVVTAENVEALPSLVELCHFLGNVSGIGLDLLRVTGKAVLGEVHLPDKESLIAAIKMMNERSEYLYELSGRKIHIREIEKAKIMLRKKTPGQDYCYASCGRSYVIIPSGDIYPCGSLVNMPKYYMGNINTDEKIKKISLVVEDYAQCKGCKYETICNRGCPSRILINRDSRDLDCTVRKASFSVFEN